MKRIKKHLSDSSSTNVIYQAITMCILKDNVESIKFIVENAKFPIAKHPRLLSIACIASKLTTIKFLFDQGINPNQKDDVFLSPLQVAVVFNKFVAFALLGKGLKGYNTKDSEAMMAIQMSLILEISDKTVSNSPLSPYKFFKKEYPDCLKGDQAIINMVSTFNTLQGVELIEFRKYRAGVILEMKEEYLSKLPMLRNLANMNNPQATILGQYVVALHSKELCEQDIEPLVNLERYLSGLNTLDSQQVTQILISYLLTQYIDAPTFAQYAEGVYTKYDNKYEASHIIVGIYLAISKGRDDFQELLPSARRLLQPNKFSPDELEMHLALYRRFGKFFPENEMATYLLDLVALANQNENRPGLSRLYANLGDLSQKSDGKKAMGYYALAMEFEDVVDPEYIIDGYIIVWTNCCSQYSTDELSKSLLSLLPLIEKKEYC